MRFKNKTETVEAEQYDGSMKSIRRIMDTFGTSGINNSEEGLYIRKSRKSFIMKKGDWLVKSGDSFSVVNPELFKTNFINK